MTDFDLNIHAELVYDGGDVVHVPERLGTPRADQMQGTPLEKLAELAGRVCYDSLGKGRSSADYHEHIREVKHLSVYEHCVRTVELSEVSAFDVVPVLMSFLNRPGVFVRESSGSALRVTLNLRALLEWKRYLYGYVCHGVLVEAFYPFVPTLRAALEDGCEDDYRMTSRAMEPEDDDERWITLLMCGSRGMSHELVRHGDFTAISQRSTRYVDESESPWVEHPLVTQKLRPPIDGESQKHPAIVGYGSVQHFARCGYVDVRDALDFAGATRKQARGAARGLLGNALYTEVVFSASVRQWRYMLQARCSDAADAEIRVLFARALKELQRSRHGDRFADLRLRPAQDGIGDVLDS